MKALTLASAAVAALALAAISAPASAAVQIAFDYELNGGAKINLGSFLTDSKTLANLNLGPFSIKNVGGTVDDNPLYQSNTQAGVNKADAYWSTHTTADLNLYVSATGLQSPNAPVGPSALFQTDLAFNQIFKGWTVTEQTWLDKNNHSASGVSLGFYTVNDPYPANSISPSTQTFFDTVNTGPGPYAITTEFTFHVVRDHLPTGKSNVNLTADITSLGGVPEPATWAMLIMGFGGIGGLLRQRHRKALALS